MTTTYSARAAAALAGITLRQLQWWDERGIVVAGVASKNHRVYSPEAVTLLRVVAELRRKRCPFEDIRRVIQYLKHELAPALEEAGRASLYLLFDGWHAWLENDPVAMFRRAVTIKSGGFYVVEIEPPEAAPHDAASSACFVVGETQGENTHADRPQTRTA